MGAYTLIKKRLDSRNPECKIYSFGGLYTIITLGKLSKDKPTSQAFTLDMDSTVNPETLNVRENPRLHILPKS